MSECYKCGNKIASNIMSIGGFHIWLCYDCLNKLDGKCVEAAIEFLRKPAPIIADLSNVVDSPTYKVGKK
jgi:hypothetical protein